MSAAPALLPHLHRRAPGAPRVLLVLAARCLAHPRSTPDHILLLADAVDELGDYADIAGLPPRAADALPALADTLRESASRRNRRLAA